MGNVFCKKYSPSEFRLPKLHNWCYHIILTIKEYGVNNGFTTIYETEIKPPGSKWSGPGHPEGQNRVEIGVNSVRFLL